jgi:serine/threonine protein kinase
MQLHHISLGLVKAVNIVYSMFLLLYLMGLFYVNVLIHDSGKVAVCNFGLSWIKADATSWTAMTDGGSIVGSCSWMAPEQLLGESLKSPCDIYAFGITRAASSPIYVMLLPYLN